MAEASAAGTTISEEGTAMERLALSGVTAIP